MISRMLLPTIIMAPLIALLAKYVPVSIVDEQDLCDCLLLAHRRTNRAPTGSNLPDQQRLYACYGQDTVPELRGVDLTFNACPGAARIGDSGVGNLLTHFTLHLVDRAWRYGLGKNTKASK